MSKELQQIKDERNRRREDGTFGTEHVDYDELRKNMSLWDKITNFFYRYKYHIIVFGFFIIAGGYSIGAKIFAPKPDYSIVVFTKQKTGSTSDIVLQDEIAKYADDVNGDGKVVVKVYDCSGDEDNENLLNTAPKTSQFMAELELGERIIYLLDDYRYEFTESYFEKTGNKQGLSKIEGDSRKVSLSDTKLMKNTESGYKGLNFCVRADGSGTKYDGTDEYKTMYKNAEKLLKNIESGKKGEVKNSNGNK